MSSQILPDGPELMRDFTAPQVAVNTLSLSARKGFHEMDLASV